MKTHRIIAACSLLVLGLVLGAAGGIVLTVWIINHADELRAVIEPGKYRCSGPYPGRAEVDGEAIVVSIADVQRLGLDRFVDWKPRTGGDRVVVYFDTDPEKQGAEYALFVYQDEWSFRRSSSRNGLYDVEMSTGEVQDFGSVEHAGILVRFRRSLIYGDIHGTWHHRV